MAVGKINYQASADTATSYIYNRSQIVPLLTTNSVDVTINNSNFIEMKVPSSLTAKVRSLDSDDEIVTERISSKTVSVPVDPNTHIYNAVVLTEKDLLMTQAEFDAYVVAPQAEVVTRKIENSILDTLRSVKALPKVGSSAKQSNVDGTSWDLETAPVFDPAKPVNFFFDLRKILFARGIDIRNVSCFVGVNVYTELLKSNELQNASAAGDSAALRDGDVKTLAGFRAIIQDVTLDPNEIIAFSGDAVQVASRPLYVPSVGEGVLTRVSEYNGISMRLTRDYDTRIQSLRSVLGANVVVVNFPKYILDRNGGQVERTNAGVVHIDDITKHTAA